MKGFLRIWTLVTLVLAIVLWLLYRAEINALLAMTRADEHHALQLAKHAIASELARLRGDALYLAEHSSLQDWLDTGKRAARTRLAADLLAFVRYSGLYDQARFLNEDGREVVRIDWNQGHPEIVSDAALQDESRGYDPRHILALDKGALYVSRFDLNIERDVSEHRAKPVIRLGTPVFDHAGRKRGLIVLNYLGQRLLDRLRESHRQHDGELWLLNSEGYWLLGPRPELEWGFMYPDRQAMRFDQEYREVWAALQAGPQESQLLRSEGLFTSARVEPQRSVGGAGTKPWILIAHVPAAVLAANRPERTRGYVLALIVLVLVLAVISGMIAQSGIQRRKQQHRIRENEARFRGLLDSAPDAIVIVDQHGCIALVNTQTERCFGYTRDELLGQPVERLIPERFRQGHIAHREGYTRRPVARPMGAGTNLFGLRKDGSEFPVEVSLSPLSTDQGVLVTSSIRDITARKQAEEARRQVQTRYQELVNNLPVGVYRNTPGMAGRFLEVNPAMLDIFEADSAEALLAHSVSDLYCDPAARNAFGDKLIQQGHVTGEELRLRTVRGREFFAAMTAAVKKDAGSDEIFFEGIVEDISERKESEHRIRQLNDTLRARTTELEAINRELEAFSYSVSHDLRAPLRAIDGFSRILLNDYAERLDDRGRDRLNRVRAAAQNMAALIDDLLKLSRVRRAELKREAIDLSMVANEVIEALQQADPRRTVRFSVQPDLNARGDPRLLRVVLDNLLDNAWKFTNRRADAEVEVGGTSNGTEVIYFVRDNGAGFDMAYANKLFAAFQRLHDTGEFPGTGIGLATAQRVIHRHGGRIWAEGAVGRGATFYFTLDESDRTDE